MRENGDQSADVVMAESVSMAMLVVLETSSPEERAVSVLREVFGFGHHELASAVDKSPGAVRQMAHRARAHVQSRRAGFEPVDPQQATEITNRFFTAAMTGDLDGLMQMLAPDVVWTADSNGKRSAARKPVTGAETVAKLILGTVQVAGSTGRVEPTMYNNAPALKVYVDDSLEGVITLEIIDGLITHFYA